MRAANTALHERVFALEGRVQELESELEEVRGEDALMSGGLPDDEVDHDDDLDLEENGSFDNAAPPSRRPKGSSLFGLYDHLDDDFLDDSIPTGKKRKVSSLDSLLEANDIEEPPKKKKMVKKAPAAKKAATKASPKKAANWKADAVAAGSDADSEASPPKKARKSATKKQAASKTTVAEEIEAPRRSARVQKRGGR